jgi:hypothetical protein
MPPADRPGYRRVAAEAVGVIHFLVAREPPEDSLTHQTDKSLATMPVRAPIRADTIHIGQSRRIVELAIDENPVSA